MERIPVLLTVPRRHGIAAAVGVVLLVALLSGCGGGGGTTNQGFRAVPGGDNQFDFFSNGSAVLSVPAGAVSSAVQITASPVSAASLPTTDGSQLQVVSPAYALGPVGQQFSAAHAATLALRVTQTIPANSELRLYYVSGGAWQPVLTGNTVTAAGGVTTVSGTITSFSGSGTYAVLAVAPPVGPS